MQGEAYKERVWAEVDLDALRFNFKQIKGMVSPSTRVLAVVKANAYGHGAVMCAQTLLSAGADYLAVATIEEALELRKADILAPILILGNTSVRFVDDLVENDITAAVYSNIFAQALSDAACRLNKQAKVHLKLNTGMERIGFGPEQVEEMARISRLPGLFIEGAFTHLACADEEDSSSVHTQYQRFIGAIEKLSDLGVQIPIRHILNSAGIFDFPEYQLDMVRPGIILYGYYPSDYIHKERAELRPVMSLKARVTHVHTLPKGAGISYGWTYRATEDVRVATVPIGYADGFSRLLSNRGHMLAGGKMAPIIGRICMDQCMIDISSGHTIDVGDEITIIGKAGEAAITADDLAAHIGTISYEILCAIGRRVPRLYVEGGDIVGVLNSFA